jgi:glycosyltransferase involved in cell wall biosynthesis
MSAQEMYEADRAFDGGRNVPPLRDPVADDEPAPVLVPAAELKLSVITPLYNDARCIEQYLERLRKTLDALPGVRWQLIFVNDASSDGSYDVALRETKKDKRLKLINLSRNFGYQAAVLAGLTEVESDLYAIIDVDCEDPPELLETLHQKIVEGHQLVYGIRAQRLEPKHIVLMRRLFYRINRLLADSDAIMWMSEFAMFTKEVRDAILAPKTTYPFLRTEMAYVGFRRCGV